MKRFSICLALMAIALVALASPANAALIVGQGDVHTSTGGATIVSTVNIINGNTSLGHTFNNNIDTNVAFGGGTVVTVGSNLLASYGFAGGGGTTSLYNTLEVVMVFALTGTTTAGTEPRFDAVTGRVGIFTQLGGAGYNQFNPLTWGAVDPVTGTALLTPIAVWDLKPAEAVFDPGPDTAGGAGPGIFNLTADQVNQISVNVTAPQANQGFFLFRETETFLPPMLSGNDFWTTTSLPAGFDLADAVDEGLILRVDESVNFNPAANTGFISGGVGTPGFDALNTIAQQLGGLGFFASSFGVTADPASFDPNPGPFASADILTTIGATGAAGVQFAPGEIPEPGAFLIWAVVGAACLGAHGWRRRRAIRLA